MWTWVVSHCECRPWPHIPQSTQDTLNGMTTRSPTLSWVTSGPISSTTPIGSCPSTSPASRKGSEHGVEVQVGAAQSCRGDPHDDVGRVSDRRIRDFVHADVADALPGESFHPIALPPPRC